MKFGMFLTLFLWLFCLKASRISLFSARSASQNIFAARNKGERAHWLFFVAVSDEVNEYCKQNYDAFDDVLPE